MRKLFLFLLLAMAGTALADDAKGSCTITDGYAETARVPKGELPPRWLLNKVTPAQYDTLAVLNRLCSVDYSMLRGYHVTPADVARLMEQARVQIRKALDTNDDVVPHIGWKTIQMRAVRPWSDRTERGVRRVEYMIYSSADGYDVHLLLRATLQRDRHTGTYRSVSYELVPYSIQGIPVQADWASVTRGSQDAVTTLEIGRDGKSPSYAVNATITFTDPMGCKHLELADASVQLLLDR